MFNAILLHKKVATGDEGVEGAVGGGGEGGEKMDKKTFCQWFVRFQGTWYTIP